MPRPRIDPSIGFWRRVEITDGCWIWRGSKNNRGYGFIHKRTYGENLAHRWAWKNLIGPIPEGLVLDHICRNRLCVNPRHLRAVTLAVNGSENTARRNTTTCRSGRHAWIPANISIDATGGQRCRLCYNARTLKWYYDHR